MPKKNIINKQLEKNLIKFGLDTKDQKIDEYGFDTSEVRLAKKYNKFNFEHYSYSLIYAYRLMDDFRMKCITKKGSIIYRIIPKDMYDTIDVVYKKDGNNYIEYNADEIRNEAKFVHYLKIIALYDKDDPKSRQMTFNTQFVQEYFRNYTDDYDTYYIEKDINLARKKYKELKEMGFYITGSITFTEGDKRISFSV